MLSTIFTSIAAFVSTNLDDLFILMLLFSQARTTKDRQIILFGQYLGAAILIAASILIAFGAGFLPGQYLHWLGFVPIALGIRVWCSREKEEHRNDSIGLASVVLLCLANGGDNIGIFAPLFAGGTPVQLAVFAVIYAVMLAFWCQLSRKMLTIPALGHQMRTYKDILVPIVFILLGIYILVK